MSIVSPCPRYSAAGTSCPKLPSGVSSYDDNINAPIGTHGGIAQPLCKYKTPWPTAAATWTAGQSVTIKFNPTSVSHSGGHCEFSISYDGGKTFAVIHRELQYCFVGKKPSGTTNTVSVNSYTFSLPSDLPSSNNAIFSWSWINASGNREFYMNCADVAITGSKSTSYTGTEMVIANYGDYPLIPEFNGDYTSGMSLYTSAKSITVSPSGTKPAGNNVSLPNNGPGNSPVAKVLSPRAVVDDKCDPDITNPDNGSDSSSDSGDGSVVNEDNGGDPSGGDSSMDDKCDPTDDGGDPAPSADGNDPSGGDPSGNDPSVDDKCDPTDDGGDSAPTPDGSDGSDGSDNQGEQCATDESDSPNSPDSPDPSSPSDDLGEQCATDESDSPSSPDSPVSSDSSDDLGEQCVPDDSSTSDTSSTTSSSPTSDSSPSNDSPTPTPTSSDSSSSSTSSSPTVTPTTTPAPVVNSNEPELICQRPTGISSPSTNSVFSMDPFSYAKFEVSTPGADNF